MKVFVKTLLIIGITGILSCDNPTRKTLIPASDYSTKIRNYIRQNIDGEGARTFFAITDSIKLNTLNAIAYEVNDTTIMDDGGYILIQDCGTDQVYSITQRNWGSFNSIVDKDMQLMILNNDASGRNIEMVNFDYLGLEMFLNRSTALKTRLVSDLELDTLIRFISDNDWTRITKIEEIDTLINKIDRKTDIEQERFAYEHFLKARPVLAKKLKEPNVLMYRLRWWNPIIEYFEVLPFVSSSICLDKQGQSFEECKEEMLKYYERVPKGGIYNLKVLRIR
jgi:hypothetical protein